MSQPNLFDGDPGFAPAQRTLFEGGGLDMAACRSPFPDPADIRRRLRAVLAKARGADRMPWGARDARMWQTVFPQMANWLPGEEAEQMRLEFAKELERLQAAS